jgi:hypothetical protein
MATSTPPAAGPDPREETLETVAAQVAAIDELVGYARQRIQVFDVDLSELGWNRAARTEALAAFFRASRTARLEIILHDTRWLEATGARMMALLRNHGTAITVYRTGSEARSAMDPLVIVDRRHCLHRFHAERPRASLLVSLPAAVQPLATRFDEIWNTGEPGLAGTVLGL